MSILYKLTSSVYGRDISRGPLYGVTLNITSPIVIWFFNGAVFARSIVLYILPASVLILRNNPFGIRLSFKLNSPSVTLSRSFFNCEVIVIVTCLKDAFSLLLKNSLILFARGKYNTPELFDLILISNGDVLTSPIGEVFVIPSLFITIVLSSQSLYSITVYSLLLSSF